MTVAAIERETTYIAEALTQGELRRMWEMASMADVGTAAGFRGNKMIRLTVYGEYATRLEAAAGVGG